MRREEAGEPEREGERWKKKSGAEKLSRREGGRRNVISRVGVLLQHGEVCTVVEGTLT